MKAEEPRLDLLELLATELETQTRIPFDYSRWVGAGWGGDPQLSCGTCACAAGLATTLKPFQELGLHLEVRPYDSVVTVALLGSRSTGERAMAEVLGLSVDEAIFLFLPNRWLMPSRLYVSPYAFATAAQVAAHIRRFVAYKRSGNLSDLEPGLNQVTT
jgi:hypothetical protein